jgi:hypothetical protein
MMIGRVRVMGGIELGLRWMMMLGSLIVLRCYAVSIPL